MVRKVVKGLNFAMISNFISNGTLGNQFFEMNFFKSGSAREVFNSFQMTNGYFIAVTLWFGPCSDGIVRSSMGRILLTWRVATSTLAIFLSTKFAFDIFQGNDIWDTILRSPAMAKSEDAYLHKIGLYGFYYEVFGRLVGQCAFREHGKLGLLFYLDWKSQFLSQNHPT